MHQQIDDENTEPSVQAAESSEALSEQEINSEKWLYVALLTVLTIGYIQLMIFAAIILVMTYSAISRRFFCDSGRPLGRKSFFAGLFRLDLL